ncbi:hypothetical protein NDU88_003893 [Pleurodeles waltl]|uniref:Uncharacterized protein n=1 Tax=Pleurodeles waltl TaxID=8319 RepID=A0AAV7PB64_PLEWA|nr:hypothetical protein NDU88_003893 [Pleurodeles waltl]
MQKLQRQCLPQQAEGTPHTQKHQHPPQLHQLPPVHIRSLHKHATKLGDFIDTGLPDIAFLIETWTNPTSGPDIAIAIPDEYSVPRTDRPSNPGGRLAIVYKSSLRIKAISEEQCTTLEHLHFLVHTDHNSSIHGTLVDRPPGSYPAFINDIVDSATPRHPQPQTDQRTHTHLRTHTGPHLHLKQPDYHQDHLHPRLDQPPLPTLHHHCTQ